ncbi:MAG: hypothetical protein AB1611_10255 [bacterium]
MRKEDVPQDKSLLGPWHEVSYAVDKDGKYVQVPSAGWEPANIANKLAWQKIRQEAEEVRKQVERGDVSPLAMHMVRHQMDIDLLSQYTHIPKRKIKQHLSPEGFRKLSSREMKLYADVFDIPIEDLGKVQRVTWR